MSIEQMNSTIKLCRDIGLTVTAVNIDTALCPGLGSGLLVLLNRVFDRSSEKRKELKDFESHINAMAAALEKFDRAERLDAVEVDNLAVILEVSSIAIQRVELLPEAWLLEYKEDPLAASNAFLELYGNSIGLPPELYLRDHIMYVVASWLDAKSKTSIMQHKIAIAFRQEVLAKINKDQEVDSKDQAALNSLLLSTPLLSDGRMRLDQSMVSPTALLNPRYAILPFHGRIDVIEGLAGWCDDLSGCPIGVRLLYGSGGRGKTRMIMELATKLRDRRSENQPWYAGMLDLSGTSLEPERLTNLFHSHTRVFIGIDQAETRVDEIAKVLKIAVKEQSESGTIIRIILIARNEGSWWNSLPELHENVAIALAPNKHIPLELPALFSNIVERQDFVNKAQHTLSRLMPSDQNNSRELSDQKISLADSAFGDPLLLQMVAMSGLTNASSTNELDVYDAVMVKERQYLRASLSASSSIWHSNTIDLVMTAVILVGGTFSRKETKKKVALCLHFESRNIDCADTIVDGLTNIYSKTSNMNDGLFALRPDSLGEYLVRTTLAKNPSFLDYLLDDLVKALPSASKEISSTLVVLSRVAFRYPDPGVPILEKPLSQRLPELLDSVVSAVQSADGPLVRLATTAIRQSSDLKVAWNTIKNLPGYSSALREISFILTDRFVGQAPEDEDDVEIYVDYAYQLDALANRYLDIARYKDAFVSSVNAINAWHSALDRATRNQSSVPNQIVVGLARSWMNSSHKLDKLLLLPLIARQEIQNSIPACAASSELRNKQKLDLVRSPEVQALKLAYAAAEYMDHFCSEYPQYYAVDYAMTLNALSNRYYRIGDLQSAYETISKTVAIYRIIEQDAADWVSEVRNKQPYMGVSSRWRSDLASSLGNLSNRIMDIRRNVAGETPADIKEDLETKSLDAILKALEIDRGLYSESPDSHRMSLTSTLVNYADRLQFQCDYKNALVAINEAVKHLEYIETQATRPIYTDDWTIALRGRAAIYRHLGRDADAESDDSRRDYIESLIRHD